MRKLFSIAAGSILTLAVGAGSVLAGGPPTGSLYEDGDLYRTLGTPTDFSGTGAPASTFQPIYDLGGGGLVNVITAAPGDPGYRGGRWAVLPITWVNIAPTQFTSDEQVLAAEANGDITIGDPVRYFECPVIKVQPNA